MLSVIGNLILLPFQLILLTVELLGRSVALIVGLGLFGFGALLCLMGPFVLFGAPLCLLSALLVIKAL